MPWSIWAFLTQVRRASGWTPSSSPILRIAPLARAGSANASNAILVARSRSSSGYFLESHNSDPSVSSLPPTNPVPFTSHERRVRRTVKAVEVPAWVGFPGAAQVVQVRRTRTTRNRKSTGKNGSGSAKRTTVEVVYLVGSLPMEHGSAQAGCGLGPRALGNREPAPLGQGRGLRRGPPPAAHRSRPQDHGRTT